jgi:hypothetical protein
MSGCLASPAAYIARQPAAEAAPKTKPHERTRAARENKELLAALGEPKAEFPATKVYERGAWFGPNIGAVVRAGLGEGEFDRALNGAIQEAGGGDAKKPMVLFEAVKRVSQRGRQSTTLASVITALRDWAGEGSAG